MVALVALPFLAQRPEYVLEQYRQSVQMLNDAAPGKPTAAGDLDGVEVTQGVDFTNGSLRQTGNPLDVAVQGSATRGAGASASPRTVRS